MIDRGRRWIIDRDGFGGHLGRGSVADDLRNTICQNVKTTVYDSAKRHQDPGRTRILTSELLQSPAMNAKCNQDKTSVPFDKRKRW
jgi:hypothetical protein